MKNNVAENIKNIKEGLPSDVSLVAVSKYQPIDSIKEAYDFGQRIFAESHVQELVKKYDSLPKDIQWHFIGHLQTNKVKYIASYISLIQSVDSIKLLKEINKHALKYNRVIDVLLELHIASEESKTGFTLDKCMEMLSSNILEELPNVRICGLMMMATNAVSDSKLKEEFLVAYDFFNKVKAKYFYNDNHFAIRSWGMSGDYKIAIDNGSNMVRIGSMIFGDR